MPDSSGKIRGITVPSVPWHDEEPNTLSKTGDSVTVEQTFSLEALDKLLHIHNSSLRDADQMLWDKQTDEGPSALEKLRDKS